MPGPGAHASSWMTTPAAPGYSYLSVVCQQTLPLHAIPAIAESELTASMPTPARSPSPNLCICDSPLVGVRILTGRCQSGSVVARGRGVPAGDARGTAPIVGDSFSPCGRRCRCEATTDEGCVDAAFPLTRLRFAEAPSPARGEGGRAHTIAANSAGACPKAKSDDTSPSKFCDRGGNDGRVL
jgi:hypothetical protein